MPPNPLRPPAIDRLALALLVDGDGDTRRMYGQFLTLSARCEVAEADDGREALAKALSRRPDVIVTETRLPGLSGFDLCTLLRRDTATSTIPIIFVTATTLEADIRRAERAGASAVLTKPCLPDRLLDEIRRVLESAVKHADEAGRSKAPRALEKPPTSEDRAQTGGARAKRAMLNRLHQRITTTDPPAAPPTLMCPRCDRPLQYLETQIGGVSARYAEQWHYYECAAGCGTFQYRARTRKLRTVS